MKVVAIITEYNPFHNGHKYQIDKVREILGEDTAIIAIMSGNYTQRGEIAICDKTERARVAVDCGVNAVLELPFPHSASSAELFAEAGVKIADALGVVDYLAFGVESDGEHSMEVFENMASMEYENALLSLSKSRDGASQGYPELCEECYNSLFCNKISREFFTPNNILASQYIKAIKKINSNLVPLPVLRRGAGYSDGFVKETELQSASYIRECLSKNDESAFNFVPNSAKEAYSELFASGKMPARATALDKAVIAKFRLNPPSENTRYFDTLGGLYNRLYSLSLKTDAIQDLVSLSQTKKFTTARIRRAVLYSFIGVTSSDVKSGPHYTQILAMDGLGRELIRQAKKVSKIPIITKPSSFKDLGDEVKAARLLSSRADAVYAMTFDKPYPASFEMTFTPYVKK